MQTVVIAGVGLIGASFGLALRKAGFEGSILGVSSPGAIRDALSVGAIDAGFPLEEAVPSADLVYLSQPIRRILSTLGQLDPLLKPGALVTDAGSTKAAIVQAARQGIHRAQFLGGHPLAGKEVRGAAAADADLFRGHTYVVTPGQVAELETPAAREFRQWIERIGAVPVSLAPEDHDRIVALTSHLPQLASTALAALLARQLASPEEARVSGPGLYDATRLALSPYEIWGDILDTNTASIDQALAAYIKLLEEFRTRLASGSLEADFQAAASMASRLRTGS
jgi:prephenate dehydrogenase